MDLDAPASDNPAVALGTRLRMVRKNSTQSAFARALGVSPATLKRYEAGERVPDARFLADLCQRYQLDPSWILWGKESHHSWAEGPTGSPDHIHVPAYGRATDDTADSCTHPVFCLFHRDWLANQGLAPDTLCMITNRGDAMEPSIPQGSQLLVDRSTSAIETDGTFALDAEGAVFVRRLQLDWQGGVVIRADNPAYQDQHLDPKAKGALRIIGRVVWQGGPLP